MDRFLKIIKAAPLAVVFAVFILGFTVFDMLYPVRLRSEMENRPLKTRPKISWSSVIAGKYDEEFDSYINDQFALRDYWITLKSLTETALLKTENNGVIFGGDGYLFGKLERLSPERYDTNISYLYEFFNKYPEQEMTLMVVPNSYEILSRKLPPGYRGVPATSEIEKIYASAPKNVKTLPLTETFTDHRDEYIFYRTDHHWTVWGAYLAASEYANMLGRAMPPTPALKVLAQDETFLGTYYSKAKKVGQRKDTITLYDIPVKSITVAGEEKGGLYDLEKLATRDKYAAYLWGNNNETVIKSANGPKNGSRALVIKDSYGNSFVPFLTFLYDEVTVLDLRYLQNVSGFLENSSYDDVIVLYNFQSLSEDGNLAKLRY